MWDYTDKVLELFYNPKNQGVLEDKGEPGIKIATGEVGSIACGDALRLHLKVDVTDDRIVDARFQTFGCTSAIASSEALAEIIKGKTLDEALNINNKNIADYLGGLPEAKIHCSVMGQEALETAIFSYRGIKPENHKDDDEGVLICTCFGVSDNKIRRVVQENKLVTAEEVTNHIKAGGGCGSCLSNIDDIIAETWEKPTRISILPEDNNSGKRLSKTLTTVQKIILIQKVLDEEVRPVLMNDGGDVEFYDIEGNTVRVLLKGACSSCPSSIATLKMAIEARLKEHVGQNLVVEAVDPTSIK